MPMLLPPIPPHSPFLFPTVSSIHNHSCCHEFFLPIPPLPSSLHARKIHSCHYFSPFFLLGPMHASFLCKKGPTSPEWSLLFLLPLLLLLCLAVKERQGGKGGGKEKLQGLFCIEEEEKGGRGGGGGLLSRLSAVLSSFSFLYSHLVGRQRGGERVGEETENQL